MNIKFKFLIGLILIILVIITWNYLPFGIKRFYDIELGNKMVLIIENYRNKTHELPQTGDWETLRKIGFQFRGEDTWPDYQKTSNTNFQLIFLKGFDGPYLMFDSIDRKWKIDFPKPRE